MIIFFILLFQHEHAACKVTSIMLFIYNIFFKKSYDSLAIQIYTQKRI